MVCVGVILKQVAGRKLCYILIRTTQDNPVVSQWNIVATASKIPRWIFFALQNLWSDVRWRVSAGWLLTQSGQATFKR